MNNNNDNNYNNNENTKNDTDEMMMMMVRMMMYKDGQPGCSFAGRYLGGQLSEQPFTSAQPKSVW
ncbi:hypothetical protein N9L19_00290 [bacterium]|nr:hypothetical protein [bacterium]